ncbi:class I SAM-dependent methyltransferase [Marivita geojedonensis]|uniref:ATP synthase subunit beta n=1 Tax=Marivita geojedonensis TaxID=1123756 RepID=A0A1X4NQD5_9RHOB|nr:SAM-dependent methyltransferase [Marivita geojedonensis]OSQ53101.1 ATP synthase subunit beta [Marivita geojedonensis]PRY81971.1 SAM-dependent MidA family methyltransferase [Marivita geojedonensis]
MTALAEILRQQIKATGPMTLAQYMSACLLHPEHGYYTTQDALGVDGDFTTAPEISQMFGEVIGLCVAQAWLDQGAPERFALIELGPGRGTLIADIMRATVKVPGFHSAAQVHLLEASDRMRGLQAKALPAHRPEWHDTAETLPEDQPVFVIANEFFDALPIRQFQRDPKGWREVMVGVADDGSLQRGLSAPAPIDALERRLSDTEPGSLVETCAHGTAVIDAIARRIVRHGGMALILDYGGWHSDGDTFQAVRAHRPVDPFEEPGRADLTAHVDFEALARAALLAGCAASQMTNQGVFLERLGITPRAQTLAKALDGAELDAHVAAHRRLTHPDEMGSLFKVLGLYPGSESPPPGLDP